MDWGYVIRGTSRQPALVFIISVSAAGVVYEAPNPWALRKGDKRAGWSKPQKAKCEDCVPGDVNKHMVDKYVAVIGFPPSLRKAVMNAQVPQTAYAREWAEAMGRAPANEPGGKRDREAMAHNTTAGIGRLG